MVIDFVKQEITSLKEKQASTLNQIKTLQQELQKLNDTNLVISGAMQALTHVLEYSDKQQLSKLLDVGKSDQEEETDNEEQS